MKQTLEFEGKNIDDAIENACSSLSVSKRELAYDVISSGSSGIFGIVGAKKAKIRVNVPEKKRRSSGDDGSGYDKDDPDGVMSIVDEAFGEVKTEAPEERPKKKSDNRRKPNKKKNEKPAPRPKAIVEDKRDEGFPPKYEDDIPVDVSEESVDLGLETLQKMIDLITTDATVVAETDQDRLLLKVEGGNAGVLIGRRGQTLEAMQFLTDKIINRKSESRVRLKVDIEGYMETRKANLINLAHKMADKAKKTGKPSTINQMTAQDRRTVHLALKNDSGVRTQSMGDGYYRRLVIFPKKGNYKKRRRPRK